MDNNCAFCDKSKFAERLIAESAKYWIVATLGQISEGYILLIPKSHIPCLGALNQSDTAEFSVITNYLTQITQVEYGLSPVIFEHGVVGQTIKHAHLHIVPAVFTPDDRIHRDFPDSPTEHIQSWQDLANKYSANPRPYLLWQNPGGTIDLYWDPPAKPQYLRIFLAEYLGVPERADWKNMNPDTDKHLWTETVNRIKKYFI